MTGTAIDKDWFENTFDALYPVLYAHRTVEAAAPESEFAVAQLELGPKDHLLDLCCGNGRHLYHLVRHAATVTGFDYSDHLLDIARKQLPPASQIVRGDMRALPFEGAFDALTNFFTSFGYFLDSRENHAVIENISAALRPGGRFFIDYLNASYVETQLNPASEREIDGMRVVEERWIDQELERVNKITLVYRDGDEIARAAESVRLYDEEEMRGLLEGCGLRVDRIFGDYTGAAFSDETPRLILVGHKVAS